MARRIALLVLVAVGAASGCAHRFRPPPLQEYTLGLSRATYRVYGEPKTAGICDAEPRWLFDELTSVNGLLDRFLGATELDADKPWSDDNLQLLGSAVQTLEPVIDQHAANLAATARCSFASQRGFPDLLERGKEYVADARARLTDAPAVLAKVRARRALEQWKQDRPLRQLSAKQGCPARGKSLELYFAYQNELGETLWLFCDGAKVSAARDGQPEFSAPEGLSRAEQRRFKPKLYLEAAKNFPGAEVSRAPTLADTEGLSRK